LRAVLGVDVPETSAGAELRRIVAEQAGAGGRKRPTASFLGREAVRAKALELIYNF